MNPKEYIKQLFAATPGLEYYDLSEGSNIYDLVISPLMEIFEDAVGKGDLASMVEQRTWSTLYDVPLVHLKKIASLNGIYVPAVTEASTLVTLYFSSPVDWDIAAGTSLSHGDVSYVTRDAIQITKGLLESHVDNRKLYYYPDMYVYNADGANVPQNSLGYIPGAPPELIFISHPPAVNGIKELTASEIIDRIKNRWMSISGSTPSGIKTIINAYFPSVDVEVVCPGDTRMLRDMVYNVVPGAVHPKVECNFAGKIRRNTVTNRSSAYFASVPEDAIGAGWIPDQEYEFTQGQYLATNEAMDSTVDLSTTNIMNETFTESSEKIGDTSKILASIDKRWIYVEEDGQYETGDSVTISDRTLLQPTQSGVVEAIESYVFNAVYNIDDGIATLTATIRSATPIVKGAKISVHYDGDVYAVYVDSCKITGNEYAIVLTEAIDGLEDAAAVSCAMKRVGLYNNLSLDIDASAGTVYLDIVNADGMYIGPGWIKSEHDMPIGTFVSENQIMVVNNELAMGANLNEREANIVKQVFLRYGLDVMIKRIMQCMDAKISFRGNMGTSTLSVPIAPIQGDIR